MKRLVAALCVFVLAAVPLFAREGFGFKKKSVDMMRTIPPATNAGARRVKIEVGSERSADRDDAVTLERYISDLVLAGNGTLAEGAKPEVVVNVSLDRLESNESWETKTEYERQQTGTKQEWNESKKKYESKPVYSNVAVQKSYKVIQASLNGTFDISDRTDDVTTGQIAETFRRTYGDYDSSPAPTAVEDDLMKTAAKKVAAQIVPTQERVSVLVPRASFEPLIPLAESGAWDRYLAAVEAMPAKRTPQEEAYRQYALAIAKEALGYANDDRNEALDLLRAAKSHYETAIASNANEELFRQGYSSLLSSGSIGAPLARASDSVAKYEKWTSAAPSRVASAAPAKAAPVKAAPEAAPAKAGMRNQTVIDLARAGLSDENIIMAIDAAQSVEFDVTPNGLISLSKNGVSKTVIAHMQKKRR